jgi:hypothetical protein
MNSKQLFETTIYDPDQDVALAVLSVPTERLPDRDLVGSPGTVLAALGLRPVAEVPARYANDALAAIIATTDADEAAEWLSEPPDPAPLVIGDDVLKDLELPWLEIRRRLDQSCEGPKRDRESLL